MTAGRAVFASTGGNEGAIEVDPAGVGQPTSWP